MRDLRKSLPQTAQNDRNKFPDYKYQPYPKMMTKIVGDKKVPYLNASGQPVIVNDATEEAQFKAKHGVAVDAEPQAKTVAVETKPVTLAAIASTEAPAKRKYTKRALPADLPA
jgi:hypothetical protein